MRAGLILVLSAVAGGGLSPELVRAADWAPKPVDNGAYLDVFAAYESDDSSGSSTPYWWRDTFLKEKLTLYSNGYFYHPRFLQYHLLLAEALKQEQYTSVSAPPSGWRHGSGLEYDAKLYFLPEHPYNFELFGTRYEPVYKDQASTQHDSVATDNGARFRYRRKPYFVHASFDDATNTSDASWSNVKRLNADAQYFKEYVDGNELSFDVAYTPSWFDATGGLSGSSDAYSAGGLVALRPVRLTVSASHNDFDQDDPSVGTSNTRLFTFYELLTADLPHHLEASASYRVVDNTSNSTPLGAPPAPELTDRGSALGIGLSHTLFQSLQSAYAYTRDDRTSSSGEATSWSHAVAFGYNKSIVSGLLLAGLNYSRGKTDNKGSTDVINEAHPSTPVPGTITLGQPNVDTTTIVVDLKSPLPPYQLIPLEEGTQYTVSTVSNTVQIYIFALPPQFVVPGTYDFNVSYSLNAGDFVFQTDAYSYNASVELRRSYLLTPYYTFAAIRSKVLSGTFPGTPVDSTTYTAGLRFQQGPLRALGEYQSVEWYVSPYRSWRIEVQYAGTPSPTTSAFATITYLNRYYPQGSSADAPESYSDRSLSASGSVSAQLLARRLIITGGGAYSRMLGITDGTSFSMSTTLTWRVGKTDLTAGASGYRVDTNSTSAVHYSRTHQYYYVRVKRILF